MLTDLVSNPNNAYDSIDWNRISQNIAQNAHFQSTRDVLLNFRPLSSLTEVNKSLSDINCLYSVVSQEAKKISAIFQSIPQDDSIGNVSSYLSKELVLDEKQISFFYFLIKSYRDLKKYLIHLPENKYLIDISDSIFDLESELIGIIPESCAHGASLDLLSHPRLKKLTDDLRRHDLESRRLVANMIRSDEYTDKIHSTEFDIIDGKFALAIKADTFNSSHGSIVYRSKGGATLFIEPSALRIRNQERTNILIEIDTAIYKICMEVSKLFSNKADIIQILSDSIITFDFVFTKTVYCSKNNFSRPEITESNTLEITGMFHPLLSDPVYNNIHLSDNKLGFVVSGPNTGGKSVLLKSVCLCHVFALAGLFVPADNAKIPWVDEIHFLSSDHQNIMEGLSSFASEAIRLLDLIKKPEIDKKRIIFIDEIFSSTSSDEASALAFFYLQELTKYHDTSVFVSTHHQMLKTLVHNDMHFISAHMEFDFSKNGPTYKLFTGSPGRSFAIDIFSKLSAAKGLSNNIVEKAKELLSHQNDNYDHALRSLDDLKEKLAQKEKALDQSLAKQKENELNASNIVMLERQRLQENFDSLKKDLFAKVNSLIDDIKGGKSSKKSSINRLSYIKNDSSQNDSVSAHENLKSFEKIEELRVGQMVYCSKVNLVMKILDIDYRKRNLYLSSGKMKIWVGLEFVHPTQQMGALKKTVSVVFPKGESEKVYFDLRGERLESFQNTCERIIFDVLNGNIPFAEIIHGHGGGILKNWLRSYIESFDDLKWNSIDGNDGVTRIELNQ